VHRFVPGMLSLRKTAVVVQPAVFFPLRELVERMHSVESDSNFANIKRQPTGDEVKLLFHMN
jgi:hypothetical protein